MKVGEGMSKKQNIIDATIKLFSSKGIEKTRMSDIAKEAGVAQGTFYLYYATKLDVMPDIANVMVDEIYTAITTEIHSSLSFLDKIEALITIVFNATKKNKKLVTIIYTGLSASDHLDSWVDAYKPYYTWLSEILENAKKENDIMLSIECWQAANIIFSIIEAAAERAYVFSSQAESTTTKDKQDVLNFLIQYFHIKQ